MLTLGFDFEVLLVVGVVSVVNVEAGHGAGLAEVHLTEVGLLGLAVVERVAPAHRLVQHEVLLVLLHSDHVLKVLLVVHLNVGLRFAGVVVHRSVQLGRDSVEVALLLVLLRELLGFVETRNTGLLQHGPALVSHSKLAPSHHQGGQHEGHADQGGHTRDNGGHMRGQGGQAGGHLGRAVLHDEGEVSQVVTLTRGVGGVGGDQATPGIGPGLAAVVPVHAHRPGHVDSPEMLERDLDRLLELEVAPLADGGGNHFGVDKPERGVWSLTRHQQLVKLIVRGENNSNGPIFTVPQKRA